jgi:hypothetical protein
MSPIVEIRVVPIYDPHLPPHPSQRGTQASSREAPNLSTYSLGPGGARSHASKSTHGFKICHHIWLGGREGVAYAEQISHLSRRGKAAGHRRAFTRLCAYNICMQISMVIIYSTQLKRFFYCCLNQYPVTMPNSNKDRGCYK